MKSLVLFTISLILFAACKQDKIVIPDTGRKLSINGLITTDSFFDVRIDETSLLRDSTYQSMTNAKVSIYQNNKYIDSLSSFPNDPHNGGTFVLGNYRSYNIFPVAGNEYKIVVNAEGLAVASASTKIPNEVKIHLVDTSRIVYPSIIPNENMTNVSMMCNIEFTDPANETNYYMFMLDRYPKYGDIYFRSQDPIIEETLTGDNYGVGIVFSDKMINGKKHNLVIELGCGYFGYPFVDDRKWIYHPPATLEGPFYIKKTFYFKLYSITEDFFRYIQTLTLYNKNYGNPLTDPVMVNSNVNGGYGIFTGAAVSTDSLVYDYGKK